MGMSGMYGQSDESESIATIHAALDRGVNLLDTGDFYGQGHNEMLIGRALREWSGDRNRPLIEALEKMAAEKGITPSQLAIAWVLAKSRSIVPVIGARTRKQLEESLGALGVGLSAGELARVEEAVPASEVAGTRYDEHQMRMLDSERT